ncbi:MAG: hypothetical protein KME49_24520 [Brasilonema octagenarum HA4186-MV1]|jgi:hypothetical protein|uniref:SPOR domain-containing protein n=1 Tax=Brasilonema octagenarum UFV-OR1 TaxID=417115 RepID=A0ABX1M6E6_9CYAN|nr:hypothetical protein [Brasilonema octagenarum]MBW4628591.1 hypothetical protein [Brasilonema octagenarum HA4186-MV1]NMF62666.1 hypothetical protein [Brasilonema octagenarum UFV-OR1]
MYKSVVQKFQISNTLVSSLLLAIVGLSASINSASAQQQNIPVCQPPNSGEYLLLVSSPTTENQKQLRQALPSNTKISTCRYIKNTVTRIGGFNKIDDANSWARYIKNIVGLSAFVSTRPSSEVAQKPSTVAQKPPTVTQKPPTATQKPPTQTVSSYKPERLGEGLAVLVDYYNRPEMANKVREVVKGDVGFVSYGERPYLLAVYTTNQKEAYSTLQKLSERGFFAVVVDSRKVMLLRSSVRLQ